MNKNYRWSCGILSIGTMALLVVAACSTSLDVKRVASGAPSPAAGVEYKLAFQQFDVTATRTYKGCRKDADGKPEKGGLPVIELTVTAAANAVPDYEQRYSIDPQSLSSFFKTSDLKVTWFSGAAGAGPSYMLQSVNAAAEDRTAQSIVNTLTGLATIGTTIASGGFAGVESRCEELAGMQAKLDAAKKAADEADAATAKVEKANAELKLYTVLAGAGGTRLDRVSGRMMTSANTAVTNAMDAQKAAAKKLAQAQKELTHSESFTWPRNGKLTHGNAQQVLLPGGFETAKKFNLAHAGAMNERMAAQAAKEFSASLRLEPLPYMPAIAYSDDTEGMSGLRYRAPAAGRLIVCFLRTEGTIINETVKDAKGDNMICGAAAEQSEIIRADSVSPVWTGSVPQLGQIKVLPYSNGPFQNNGMGVTFNADGSPASVQYVEKTARGETISEAFANAAKAATTGVKGIVNAPTARLKAQVDAATLRNSLVTQTSTLTTAEQIGMLQANTNLMKAQLAFDEAQEALENARAAKKQAATK
jgi:hypothetical protein